jgi:glycosyltransferase involved in cell wall biosynthesis
MGWQWISVRPLPGNEVARRMISGKNGECVSWETTRQRRASILGVAEVNRATMRRKILSLYKTSLKPAVAERKYALKRWLSRNTASRKIVKIDSNPVPTNSRELRLFMVVRNESLRLPFILNYYFSQDVDRMFFVDNGSSDDTASIVSSKENTHLFSTEDRFAHKQYWIDWLLNRYGQGHWCLVVDADEVLTYPYHETLTLRELCAFLDKESATAMDFVLLDMYPNLPIGAISYEKGTDPLLIAPWFDKYPYVSEIAGPMEPICLEKHNLVYKGPERVYGGMRRRVFGLEPCLSKFALVKFDKTMFLSTGAHFVQNARVAGVSGAILHFKYLNDFAERAKKEATRGEYWQNASEYKEYLRVLNSYPDLNFYSDVSEKFISDRQLVALNIMKSSATLDTFVGASRM